MHAKHETEQDKNYFMEAEKKQLNESHTHGLNTYVYLHVCMGHTMEAPFLTQPPS